MVMMREAGEHFSETDNENGPIQLTSKSADERGAQREEDDRVRRERIKEREEGRQQRLRERDDRLVLEQMLNE